MKKNIKLFIFILVFTFTSCSPEPPTLCECLTTGGDLPTGCEKVFINRYGTSDPSTDQMRGDYYNCK